MLKVAFGVTVLSQCMANGGVDGIGSYTKELLSRLNLQSDLGITPFSFGAAIPNILLDGRGGEKLRPYHAATLYSSLTNQSFLGHKQLSEKVDLVHASDHYIAKMGKIPVVATLMDAIPLSHPEWVTSRFRSVKNIMWRRASRWAAHIITISDYSKMEIVEHFGIAEDKITVIPLAVGERWFLPISEKIKDAVAVRLNLPKNYCLFVGTLQPRKNIRRVIEAHQQLPEHIRKEFPLIIIGRDGWDSEEVVTGLKEKTYGPYVHWLQYLSEDDLHVVMKKAKLLVFPSLHEGFGLPVLEAMAAGVPVVTSNTTSLPEVAADAALLVDPLDASSIAESMLRICEDEDLANELGDKGLFRARQFTWDKTAKLTVDVYHKLAG